MYHVGTTNVSHVRRLCATCCFARARNMCHICTTGVSLVYHMSHHWCTTCRITCGSLTHPMSSRMISTDVSHVAAHVCHWCATCRTTCASLMHHRSITYAPHVLHRCITCAPPMDHMLHHMCGPLVRDHGRTCSITAA